jgi:hypothetical protein
VLVFLIIGAALAALGAYFIFTAPLGWEDEGGFHYGRPPESARPDFPDPVTDSDCLADTSAAEDNALSMPSGKIAGHATIAS